jgi:hypothetical protein
MKPILALTILALLSTSCGKSDSPAPVVVAAPACSNVQFLGTWTEPGSGDVLTLNANCTATTTECGQKFTFTVPDTNDEIIVVISEYNGDLACLPPGTYTCAFDVSGNQLGFDCGSGVFIYEK